MVTDTSAESRKVDKKTALALWDSAMLAPSLRKKRGGEEGGGGSSASQGDEVMSFTLVSKRGNKQQVSRDLEAVEYILLIGKT
jgi:regulator of nonsense transcripts 2